MALYLFCLLIGSGAMLRRVWNGVTAHLTIHTHPPNTDCAGTADAEVTRMAITPARLELTGGPWSLPTDEEAGSAQCSNTSKVKQLLNGEPGFESRSAHNHQTILLGAIKLEGDCEVVFKILFPYFCSVFWGNIFLKVKRVLPKCNKFVLLIF